MNIEFSMMYPITGDPPSYKGRVQAKVTLSFVISSTLKCPGGAVSRTICILEEMISYKIIKFYQVER